MIIPRLRLVGATTLFIAVLSLVQNQLLADRFSYYGFVSPSSVSVGILFGIFALLPAFLMPTELRRPSTVLLLLHYMFVHIPIITLLPRTQGLPISSAQAVLLTIVVTLSFTLLVFGTRLEPLIVFPSTGLTVGFRHTIVGVFLVLIAVTTLPYVQDRGTVGFFQLSALRGEFTGGLPAFTGYAAMWSGNIIGSFLLSIGILRRNIYLIVTSLLFFFISFNLLLSRSLFFIPIFIVFIVYIVDKKQKFQTASVIWYIALGLLVLMLLYGVTRPNGVVATLIGWIVLRVFSIQGRVTLQYYSFFSDNPKIYLSHIGPLRQFLDYPYDKPLPILMESVFHEGNLNTGFIGTEGIASFGLLGVLLASLFVLIFLRFLDGIGTRIDHRVGAGVAAGLSLGFTNYPFSVFLLTGGGILFIVYGLMVPASFRRPAVVRGNDQT